MAPRFAIGTGQIIIPFCHDQIRGAARHWVIFSQAARQRRRAHGSPLIVYWVVLVTAEGSASL